MTKKTGPFRLSACMMVKDEEANLPRCLNSIKPLIDELIIVDTGSSDKTIQIAESFGASIHHHPWADDFSLHRNQSISYATGDWILIIDADEELIFGDSGIEHIRQTLQETDDKDAFAVVMKNIQETFVTSQTIHVRFFRNDKISYTGIVHNQPVFKGTANLLAESDTYLNHYGYSTENIEKKAKRTIPLLKKQLDENPENWQCYFYLSQIYGNLLDPEKSIEMGKVYIEHKDEVNAGGHKNFQDSVYTGMLSNLMELGRLQETIEIFNEAFEAAPYDLDIARNEVEIGVWTKNLLMTLHGTYRFIDLYNRYQKDFRTAKNNFIHSFLPEALAYCLRQCIELCTPIFLNAASQSDPLIGEGMVRDYKEFLKDQGLI